MGRQLGKKLVIEVEQIAESGEWFVSSVAVDDDMPIVDTVRSFPTMEDAVQAAQKMGRELLD